MRHVIPIFLFLMPFFGFGQKFVWDVGGQAGVANYFGDLASQTGTNSFNVIRPNTRYNIGGFVRKRLNYRFGLRFEANYLMVTGADSLNSESPRASRNLHFRNNIIEASGRLEYYPLIINDVGGKMRYKVDFHLMGFVGIGVAYHNPQAQQNGSWVDLRPLKTENVSYSPVEPVIPIGLGGFFTFKTKYQRFRRHRIGIEVNYRKMFTDYLDDVSSVYPDPANLPSDQARELSFRGDEVPGVGETAYPSQGRIRGNPDRMDAYGTIMISYSYVLRTNTNGRFRPKYNYQYGKSPASIRKMRF